MSDTNDVKAPNNERIRKDQDSLSDGLELMRSVMDRVAMDGTKDFDLLDYLRGIAANTAWGGVEPREVGVVHANDAAQHQLIKCLPNQRIVVFDLLVSLNAVTQLTFTDRSGNYLLATMMAPNAGQGFCHSSFRGIPLPRERSLFVQSANAITYSVHASYGVLQDEGE